MAAGLHQPINANPCGNAIVLPGTWRALLVRQGWKDLSVLFGDGFKLMRSSSPPSVPQPLRHVLYYGHVDLLGLMVRLAEGVGSAPTSVVTDPVFETGAASLYLPAFHKMAARVGLAPTPNGLTGRRATLTLPGNG